MKNDLKSIYFPVEKLELKDYLHDMEFDPAITHGIFATTKEGKKRLINVCSSGYGLIPNKELIQPILDDFEAKFGEVEVKAYNFHYARFRVDVILKKDPIKFSKGTIFPKVTITNSYDSSVRFMGSAGIFRLECLNGLSTPVGKGIKVDFMHTSGAVTNAENFIESIREFADNTKDIKQMYEPMTEKILTPGRAQEIIEEVRNTTSYPKMAVEFANQRLQEELTTIKAPLNEFILYNALNWGLFNSPSTLRDHKKFKIDQEVLNFFLP